MSSDSAGASFEPQAPGEAGQGGRGLMIEGQGAKGLAGFRDYPGHPYARA
ncbi:hypothetical protein J2853_001884 [Streptosporangium lutulentum]|uniref:Uncharacterized protein n=1 Tax=Streptosporangium lutulentum TaxID=1461250 RepID=A0ABT9Q8M6_9ACTN|nr:hypothetical protein [Streptosporangium lutulentum]